MATQKENAAGTAVATANTPSLEQLKNVNSFEDIMQLAKDLGAVVTSSSDLGDGFSLLEDKDKLVGVPCVFVTWTFSPGDYGKNFVSARVVAQTSPGQFVKYVVNDGGTGICDQLAAFSQSDSGASMLYAQKGLRKSEYKYTDSDGQEKPAVTYYIDTSGTGLPASA